MIVVTPLILSSCGTRTLLEDTAYETYEEALEVANEKVYKSGISHSGESDKKNVISPNGFEYKCDIYYNTSDEMFYITQAYTSNLINEVEHKSLLHDDDALVMIGFTHYHPLSSDISLTFSRADEKYAGDYDVAAHIINANKETAYNYKYLPNWKKEYIRLAEGK